MLLAVDIGNTNIYMGLWQEDTWLHSWRAQSVTSRMPDEYAVIVRNFLNSADIGWKAITGVIIGSVVPELTEAFVEMIDRYTHLTPIVVTHNIRTGVKIEIDQPEQAGADRIVNAAAVVALHTVPAIVIDFGTATTLDVVSADGAYIGGAIAPGIRLAHDALVSRAARLHKIDLIPPPDPIGRNTIHAMQSGIFWGYVSLIEGLTRRTKESIGGDAAKIKVIATGGLAPIIHKYTDVIDTIAPNLTLDGLRVIYNLNKK